MNGAVAIYNLVKKCVDFQTEPGHAETVFDIEFPPINRYHIASCSYDETVRIWDVN